MNGSAEKHVIESLKKEPQKSIASKAKKGQITSFGGFSTGSSKVLSGPDRKEPADSSRQKEVEQTHTVGIHLTWPACSKHLRIRHLLFELIDLDMFKERTVVKGNHCNRDIMLENVFMKRVESFKT